ncbi:MAG: phosphatase PAP2 family protein [Clostridia bacterium]|nr:phosphatase PAP2 family protein [Clostridia bacterium]
MDAINQFEIGILNFIQEHFSCKFLDYFFMIITKFSDEGLGWIALAIVLLCFKKTRKTGICLGVVLIIGEILGNQIIKKLFERPRPYTVNPDFTPIIPKLKSFSFPSGHTRCAVECAMTIFLNNKKWGIAALVFAALTGLSRNYLYMHYPTDVLAGAVLGIIDALLAVFIVKKIYEYANQKKLNKKA